MREIPNPIHVEEASLNAWPAVQTIFYDAWIVRMARGYTKRANSVTPLACGSRPLAAKVSYCESLFRRCGLTPTFRIPSFVPDAHALDALLAAQAYRRIDETLVMTVPLAAGGMITQHQVCERHTLEEWLPLYHKLEPGRTDVASHREILGRVVGNTAYVSLEGDEVFACGLGVCEAGYAGFFDIVVRSTCRRKGYGLALMENLLAWGVQEHASHAYVQVVANNSPAVALYAKLGFQELYRYWYRSPETL